VKCPARTDTVCVIAALKYYQGSKKPGFFKKKAQPSWFFGVLLVFWVLLDFFGQAGK